MKIKQRPEDFVVREGSNFEPDREGPVWIYRMDKQKLSTLQALERIGKEFGVRRRKLSVCGLKDKQGRTEQLVGVEGGALGEKEVVQSGDLRLQLIGRAAAPLTSHNVTANRFEVTIRDLSREEAERVPESVKEVERTGIVNYFDSQRFGFLKHGQGFIGKQLIRGDFEGALKSYLATPSVLDRSDDAKVKAFWKENWGQWRKFAPQKAGAVYAPMLKQLRSDPENFKGAFMHIERRSRMMTLFELQSFLWNEGVRRYLLSVMPPSELIGLRYQAGALVFPRAISPELQKSLAGKTFPLLSSESTFSDPLVEKAAVAALQSQGIALSQMKVPETPQLFFKHEERPLFIHPGKLRVSEARPDEMNTNRLKLTLSFTLPPGAYATLVVRRVFWFSAEGFRELAPESAAAKASKARARAAERQEAQRGQPHAEAEHERVEGKQPRASVLQKAAPGSSWAAASTSTSLGLEETDSERDEAAAQPPKRQQHAPNRRDTPNREHAPNRSEHSSKNPGWGQPREATDSKRDRGNPRPERSSAIHPDRSPQTNAPEKAPQRSSAPQSKPVHRPAAPPPSEPAVHVDPRSNGFLARQKAKKAMREAARIADEAKARAKRQAKKERRS